MSAQEQLRRQIIEWSNRFPLDYSFRKKRQIIFGSEQHRALNEIDIYFEWLEEKLHNEFVEMAKQQLKNEKDYADGTWIRSVDDDDNIAFKKIKVGDFNSSEDDESINIG